MGKKKYRIGRHVFNTEQWITKEKSSYVQNYTLTVQIIYEMQIFYKFMEVSIISH